MTLSQTNQTASPFVNAQNVREHTARTERAGRKVCQMVNTTRYSKVLCPPWWGKGSRAKEIHPPAPGPTQGGVVRQSCMDQLSRRAEQRKGLLPGFPSEESGASPLHLSLTGGRVPPSVQTQRATLLTRDNVSRAVSADGRSHREGGGVNVMTSSHEADTGSGAPGCVATRVLCAVRIPGEPVLTTATACGTAVRSSLSSARLPQWSKNQVYASNVYYTLLSQAR